MNTSNIAERIEWLGGRTYKVTINNETRVVDLGKLQIVTPDTLEMLKVAGVDTRKYQTYGNDAFWNAAAKLAL